MPVLPASAMDALGTSILKSADGAEVPASQLWADAPVVILVLRRPGCVLCRDEAQKLWKLNDEVKALGVSMVTVVHEWREREIAAFTPEFWAGPVYHDTSKAFYKAVNGGELRHGTVMGLLNPFSATWKRVRAASKDVPKHNLVGEGLIMGGLLVVGAGGTGPFFSHVETDLGVHADHVQVMEAVRAAALAAKVQHMPAQAVAPHVETPVAVQTVAT